MNYAELRRSAVVAVLAGLGAMVGAAVIGTAVIGTAAPANAALPGPTEVAAWAGRPGSLAASIRLSEAYAVQVAFGAEASASDGAEGEVTVRVDLSDIAARAYLTAYSPACALAGDLLSCTASWSATDPLVTFVVSVKPVVGTPAGHVGTIGLSVDTADDTAPGNNSATIQVDAKGPMVPSATPPPTPGGSPTAPPATGPPATTPGAPYPPRTTNPQPTHPQPTVPQPTQPQPTSPQPTFTVPAEPTLGPGVTVDPNITLTPGGVLPPGLSPSGNIIVTMPPEPGIHIGPGAAGPFEPSGSGPAGFTWVFLGTGAFALVVASALALIALRRAAS